MLTEDVRRSAEARGPAGAAWIEALPGIVAHLRDAWSLTIGESLPGGKAALVLRVGAAGADAVLKVGPPDIGFAAEVAAIAAADGHGYVRLLAADLDRNAALSHRLASDAPTVLCHGDPHVGNALAVPVPRPGAASGYVFVDPDGFSCEPAYDLGVTVRSYTSRVLAAGDPVALVRGWCDRLAAATGVDRQAIWEWGFFERVSTGLSMIRYGHPEEGRAHLASAERLLPC